ncbi:MAG: DUF3891 family protein [Bacteroidetes bacterium]|nr:DUF3891 family protein [Bacteroidota bacterium]MBU1485199.1 DUF3891 family protein [Bacteroidota bacterium]MBU2047210.1 DUF3891 family protein [Bacteroidota bacterium]MBU2268615.1 DUF3891 family protein [Bacteroidota bacterium]MBU2376593.1 DUF3891 family protein [Bacteroidota bacterium]
MIVRQDQENLIFITQHDHAYIAGEFFTHFKKEFIATEHYESLKFAVHQHDRAWIIPDTNPIVNDSTNFPFTFIDYPERLKLHFYKLGIEQVDQANSYAALLCSMHYAGYVENFKSEAGKQFYEREQLRQKHLINKLKIPHDRLLQYQLKILRFCDDLSLYVCMNKPGAAKEEEVDLFKKGFKDSEFFSKNGETKIIASYREKGRNVIKFNSSPFEEPFEIKVHCKRISKQLINDIGLADAYEAEPVTFFLIQLT